MRQSWQWALVIASVVTEGAMAQGRLDPADPMLATPAFEYVSPFASYRRYEEVKPAPWRELNEQVFGLGGHAGHIRDGTSGAPNPDPAANPERASRPPAIRGESMPSQPAQPSTAPPTDHSMHKR